MSTVYDFSAASLTGKDINFEQYRGKVLLIVNTASKCGFTPQYKGLQELFAQYKEKGLEILGFPCNQFGKQEPGEGEQISEFCEVNYGVDFQMFSKIDVNGDNTHPLYQHLKAEAPGLLGSKAIKWNFTKFLVGKDGKVVKRYAPTDTPASIEKDIVKLL